MTFILASSGIASSIETVASNVLMNVLLLWEVFLPMGKLYTKGAGIQYGRGQNVDFQGNPSFRIFNCSRY